MYWFLFFINKYFSGRKKESTFLCGISMDQKLITECTYESFKKLKKKKNGHNFEKLRSVIIATNCCHD